MAQYDVPVTITARDEASAAIKGIGKTAKTVSGTIAKFGSIGGKALEAFSQAATGLMATKDLILTARDAMIGFVERAIEFRGESDQLTRSFREQANEVNALSARIGDVLLNAFIAVTEQFKPMIQGARDFLAANQQMLAIGIVEFLQDAANAMVNVLAPSIQYATRIVAFFQMSWEALKAGVNSVIGAIAFGVSELLRKVNELAAGIPFMSDSLKEGLSDAAVAADGLSMAFLEAADESVEATHRIAEEQAALEFQVGKVATTITKSIGDVSTKAIQALGTATIGANKPVEELGESAEKSSEKVKELNNSIVELNTDAATQAVEAADTIGTAFGVAFASAEDGQNRFGAALSATLTQSLQMIIDFVRKSVMAFAIDSAAKAGSSAALLGPAAIVGVTSVVLGLFEGLLAKLPGMAEGGMVRGGRSGQDSVPALLMPGEYVMNVNQVEAMRQMFSNMDGVNSSGRFANGGTVGAAPSLGGVNITIRSEALPNKTEVAKYVRSTIMPAMRDLQAQGAI
jgi:hypothetical protein